MFNLYIEVTLKEVSEVHDDSCSADTGNFRVAVLPLMI